MEGGLPVGDLIERSALLLTQTARAVVRLDETSASLLEARFEIRSDDGMPVLLGERSRGDAPRTVLGRVTPFVGRERDLSQLQLIFGGCIEESVARVVLVTGSAGA